MNWEINDRKIAICTVNKKEWNMVEKKLTKLGYTWGLGDGKHLDRPDYATDIAICVRNGYLKHGSRNYFERNDYRILEANDIFNLERFPLSERQDIYW